MGSWVGPWVPFSKLSRQKAVETCEILIEQRDRQIRRAEAAEARLAEVEARLEDFQRLNEDYAATGARLREVESRLDLVTAERDTAFYRLAEVEAERDGFDSDFRDLIAAHSAAEKECTDLRARLVEVETRLRAASVLEIDFKVRDRIIAAARGEGERDEAVAARDRWRESWERGEWQRAEAAEARLTDVLALCAQQPKETPCSCDPAYTERGLIAPDCAWHQDIESFVADVRAAAAGDDRG